MKINKTLLGFIAIAVIIISIFGSNEDIVETNRINELQSDYMPTLEEDNYSKETIKELVLVEDNLVKIVATEKVKDLFGSGIEIIAENKTDKNIIVQTRNTSVNGVMSDALLSIDITPGKKGVSTMTFMDITELKNLINIEGNLAVISDDFLTTYGEYTFNIK